MKSFKFIISLYFALTKVRIWHLHCSLGNQNTITCKLELHAIQLKGRCTSLYAKGPQGPGMQGLMLSWYAGLSAALDQGIVGETHLYYRQANKPRVRAEIPYHTITPSPIPCLERLNLLTQSCTVHLNLPVHLYTYVPYGSWGHVCLAPAGGPMDRGACLPSPCGGPYGSWGHVCLAPAGDDQT